MKKLTSKSFEKTATLISSCCAIGAASVGASEKEVENMRNFGSLVGMAFQIKDDLLDYQSHALIGKPTSKDIKEKKITLPMIYVFNHASKKDKKWLISSVKNHHLDQKRVKEVMDFVKENNGIEYATLKMTQFCESALELLKEYPDSPYRKSLESLIAYVVNRKK